MSMIYLDHAATTQMTEEVERAMEPYLREKFGNASTEYSYGADAGRAHGHARNTMSARARSPPLIQTRCGRRRSSTRYSRRRVSRL